MYPNRSRPAPLPFRQQVEEAVGRTRGECTSHAEACLVAVVGHAIQAGLNIQRIACDMLALFGNSSSPIT